MKRGEHEHENARNGNGKTFFNGAAEFVGLSLDEFCNLIGFSAFLLVIGLLLAETVADLVRVLPVRAIAADAVYRLGFIPRVVWRITTFVTLILFTVLGGLLGFAYGCRKGFRYAVKKYINKKKR